MLQGSTVIGNVSIFSLSDQDSKQCDLLGGQKIGKLDFCEHCVCGKHRRVKFSTAIHKMKGTIDYIHSDHWGSSLIVSKGSA